MLVARESFLGWLCAAAVGACEILGLLSLPRPPPPPLILRRSRASALEEEDFD